MTIKVVYTHPTYVIEAEPGWFKLNDIATKFWVDHDLSIGDPVLIHVEPLNDRTNLEKGSVGDSDSGGSQAGGDL